MTPELDCIKKFPSPASERASEYSNSSEEKRGDDLSSLQLAENFPILG